MTDHTPGPWRQGTTLKTRVTERWSTEQIRENERLEECLVFANFSSLDAGRSRVLVAHCQRPEDARLIAAAPDLLKVILAIQEKGWTGLDAADGEIRRMALAAVQKAMPPVIREADHE